MSQKKDTTPRVGGMQHHSYGYYPQGFTHMEGRLLTVIEALGLKETQEKAFKDVVRDVIYEFSTSSYYISPEDTQRITEEGLMKLQKAPNILLN